MRQGDQGKVILSSCNGVTCVKKTSNKFDNSIDLEVDVLKKVATLNSPHFPKLLCYDLKGKKHMMKIEYIDGPSVFDFIDHEKIYKSLTDRTLIAAAIMNEQLGIVHNDLHSDNVMVRKTDIEIDRYVFADGETFEYETYGYEPVIIDFGMAFSTGRKMKCPIGYTHVGIFPFEMDMLSDARRIVPQEFNMSYLVKHGWFKEGTFKFLPSDICKVLQLPDCDESDNMIEIFAAQIKLPLERVRCRFDTRKAYATFCDAFSVVRSQMKSPWSQYRFIKFVLEHSVPNIVKTYGISTNTARRIKRTAVNLLMAINNAVCTFADYALPKKQEVCIDLKFSSVRQVVAHRYRRLRRLATDTRRVRTYYVAERRLSI